MEWGFVAAIVVGVFGTSCGLTKVACRALKQRSILDHPNERSSHVNPTPRGGGLAVMAAVLPSILIVGMSGLLSTEHAVVITFLALVLAVVSWLDDLRGLSPLVRLGAHILAVATALSVGIEGPFFGPALPRPIDTLAAALFWVWFINLFNFMDGIDGISSIETIFIGLGTAVTYWVSGLFSGPAVIGLLAAASAVGFLVFNWPPARIFLGDVGSVPLGFLLGWLLLTLAADGHLAAAVILPLYYLTDATWTLLARMVRGEKFWHAHREHFYQKAVQGGLTHKDVSLAVAAANAMLILLAVASLEYPWSSVCAAFCLVGSLVFYLARPGRAVHSGDR